MAVELNGVEDHGAFAVVLAHLIQGERINGALQPRFLGIDENGRFECGCTTAQGVHTCLDAFPSLRLHIGQLFGVLGRLLQQGCRGHATNLEDRKPVAVVALGRFNGLENALVRGVQVGFLLLALGTVVEDGVDLVVGQGRNRLFAFGNGLASAEVAVDCRANGPAYRYAQGESELH